MKFLVMVFIQNVFLTHLDIIASLCFCLKDTGFTIMVGYKMFNRVSVQHSLKEF